MIEHHKKYTDINYTNNTFVFVSNGADTRLTLSQRYNHQYSDISFDYKTFDLSRWRWGPFKEKYDINKNLFGFGIFKDCLDFYTVDSFWSAWKSNWNDVIGNVCKRDDYDYDDDDVRWFYLVVRSLFSSLFRSFTCWCLCHPSNNYPSIFILLYIGDSKWTNRLTNQT